MAYTDVAVQYDMTRPIMTTDIIFNISEGRCVQHINDAASFMRSTDTHYKLRTAPGSVMTVTCRMKEPKSRTLAIAVLLGSCSCDQDLHVSMLTLTIIDSTGPNACGKTVYMKTMTLITYLAQIGRYSHHQYFRASAEEISFVPAASATIGLVDQSQTIH